MNEKNEMQEKKRLRIEWVIIPVLVVILIGILVYRLQAGKYYTQIFYGMSTLVDQKAYGWGGQKAADGVQEALVAFEENFSLYDTDSDIAAINAAAGGEPVSVAPETIALLQQAVALSAQSDGAFALTLAPVSLAWGVNTEAPKVQSPEELATLLPLVNDASIEIDAAAGTVRLAQAGQGIDLGGIAKGAACDVARQAYRATGVKGALLSIGGNVLAYGKKADGKLFRVGFRDPTQDGSLSVASISLQDKVFAVSGGYERFFEVDGKRYHHIFDPKTGMPAESDIASVGVVHENGAEADFYSTTLFVWGKERALAYFRAGGSGMLLDNENNLYVSADLKDTFELTQNQYTVYFL